jgi:adenylate cyclase
VPAVLKHTSSGEAFALDDFTLIGRGDGVTLQLADAGVSRQHASIRREHYDYWLVDLGSANGSYVNGVELTSARVLRHGDRVQFGGSLLIFEQSGAAQGGDVAQSDRTVISFEPLAPVVSEEVTLFVADLKGFTGMSESLAADQVAALLREWYADCQSILRHHGATIDKFIGDSVFAFWPGTDAPTRAKALAAAGALRLAEADPQSPTRRALREGQGISLDPHIGIHVGTVAIGQMGKGINTALGDAVNVVFRIEALTRTTRQPVLVSAAFVDGWQPPGITFGSCGHHSVKGIAEPIEVFAPSRPAPKERTIRLSR